jgi:hypothetical protein
MKLAWKDTLLGAVLHDATGRIIGEISESEYGGNASMRRCHATFHGERIGDYISREFARKAVEAAAASAPTQQELMELKD